MEKFLVTNMTKGSICKQKIRWDIPKEIFNSVVNYFTLLIVSFPFLTDSVLYLYFINSTRASYFGHQHLGLPVPSELDFLCGVGTKGLIYILNQIYYFQV